jgi:tRNA G10  N-methylase Trm11
MRTEPFDYSTDASRLKVHNVFRYPAKFHPPVAAKLVEDFSAPGDTVLDPFCGSGTLLVEAIRSGRNAYGGDVDPLAVFISKAKTARYDVDRLESAYEEVVNLGKAWERSEASHTKLMHTDLSERRYTSELGDLWVPAIPNLSHWFRRYVTVDLARLLDVIEQVADGDPSAEAFLLLSFAAIIRNASNADPVPVSGLEVTSHMRRRDAEGRPIDVWALFRAKARRVLNALREFEAERGASSFSSVVRFQDARLSQEIPEVQAVITSPPYQSAVDYYRRHQLEMFWLRMTESQADRLALLPHYVGRANTPQSHQDVLSDWQPSNLAAQWLEDIGQVSDRRARDFHAYFSAMTRAFASMSDVLGVGGLAVVVVGRSQWGGVPIPTEALFKELVPSSLKLTGHLTYPISNRTMSYSRHNGADINEEHILAFSKQAT